MKISAGAYKEPKANVSAPVTSEKKEVEQVAVAALPSSRTGKCHCQERYRHCYAKPKCECSIYFDPDNMVAQKDATLTRAWEDLNTEVKFNNGNYEITIPTGATIAGKYATRIKAEKVTSKETVGEATLPTARKP